jgi:ATP-dependent protease ClpP protease subunit
MASSPTHHAKRRAARQGEPLGTLTAKADNDEGELVLFGTIGDDFWGEGITDVQFDRAVKELGDVKTIRLRANSGGGDVFMATAMYNILVKHPARVVIEIEGVAASAMTLVAMAGDEIHIAENAHFMIHNPRGIAWGTADELRQYLKLLDNSGELMRLTYSARTGLSDVELVKMLSFDNWMTAKQAKELGFVDAIDPAKTVKPHVTPDDPEDAAPASPTQVTPQRLAAMAGALLQLSANVRPTTQPVTGGSPPPAPKNKEDAMLTAKQRVRCLAFGMPYALDDDTAAKWYSEHEDQVLGIAPPAPAPATNGDGDKPPKDGPTGLLTSEQFNEMLDAREQRQIAARATWRKEVDATLSLAFGDSPPTELKDECYALQADGVDALRAKVQEAKKKADTASADGGVRISYGHNQPNDRHRAALKAGLMVRALRNFSDQAPRLRKQEDGSWQYVTPSISEVIDKHLPEKDRAKDWQHFSEMSLIQLAEESLVADGLRHEEIRRMSVTQIAMTAMGYGRGIIRAEAVHTTGSLPEITRDAVNKSLTAGYEEAPQTWRGPFRQAASVRDFKDKHVVKLGAAPNLPIWPDNTAPEEAKLSNEKEKYAVEAHAGTISFSWQLILNDDLDALSRRPQLMGDAAGRTVNAVAWQELTGNPAMSDGQVLFLETPTGNRKRKNLTTGSATPTNTTIGDMRALMRLMRGLNTPEGNESEDVLNIMPVFILAPASLEELILKQVFSGADPAASGNSAVYNTSRNLTPIIEPLLDAASTTAWYLAASPSRVDTIEVTFLQGQETPISHEFMDDRTMSQIFTVIQSFKAKAIDHRGLQKHDGA